MRPALLLLVLLTDLLTAAAPAQAGVVPSGQKPSDPFVLARNAWAHHFMDGPAVHLELAKLHRDHGREELAMILCEETRHRFGDAKFDAAFATVFAWQPAPQPEGELAATLHALRTDYADADPAGAEWQAAVAAALEKFPDSPELMFYRARAMEARGESARAAWDAALAKAPRSPLILGWTARSRWMESQDGDGALSLSYRTYLLEPHFYDVTFVERRIQEELGPKRSFALYTQAKEKGDFRQALSLDLYWGVERAVQKLRKDWEPSFVKDAVRMLAHDVVKIRWDVAELLVEKHADVSDETLGALLADADLRVRGLALAIAVRKRGAAALPTAEQFLASDVQLLRFDAISALSRHGGKAGQRLVAAHAAQEKDPALVEMLERSGRR